MMTFKQFCEKLKALDPKQWQVYLDAPSPVRLKTRGGSLSFCPITAVCYQETKKRYTVDNWEKAAKALGLRRMTADAIVRGADGVASPSRAWRAWIEDAIKHLRYKGLIKR